MKRIVSSVVVVMAIGVGVNELIGHAQQTTVATTQLTKDVRKKLAGMRSVQRLLKKDAEREAREVKG